MTGDADRQHEFQQVVAKNHSRLHGICTSFADRSDHQDLYQEILLQLWRSHDQFDGRASRETWVYRVALNTALAWRRKLATRKKHIPPSAVDPDTVGANSIENREEQILQEFLQSLSPVNRALMVLFLDNLSHREMGEVTGMNENQIAVRLHRIRQQFNERYVEAEQ